MNSNQANWIKINKRKLPRHTRRGSIFAYGAAQYRVESDGGWGWFAYWLLSKTGTAPSNQAMVEPPVVDQPPPVIMPADDAGSWSPILPGILLAGAVAAELATPTFAQSSAQA